MKCEVCREEIDREEQLIGQLNSVCAICFKAGKHDKAKFRFHVRRAFQGLIKLANGEKAS